MTKKTKLVWRLAQRPSPAEVQSLVSAGIISIDEAREILFNTETEEDRDANSLKSEIKFLREIVEKLSKGRSQIVETIREVQVPYYQRPWFQPYAVWCSTTNSIGSGGTLAYLSAGTGATTMSSTNALNTSAAVPFSSIGG